jgi:predicted site-specific integrase-resolvase
MDMSNQPDSPTPSVCTLEVYEPNPNVLYSLEATAHLARVPRRSVLIYCRAGLLRPVFQPPHGVMGFTEEAIYAIRRIEKLRAVHSMDVSCIKTMFDLLDEVERLRTEIRFFRSH